MGWLSKVCGKLRNRVPRYCDDLVDNYVLDNEFFEIMSSTGSVMAQLLHWVSTRKDAGKSLSLSVKKTVFVNILIIVRKS